jgi:hypothetical protein
MDKFKVVVIIVGSLTLITFSLYNFGYYFSPSIPQSGAKIEPISKSELATDAINESPSSTQPQKQIQTSNTAADSNSSSSIKMANYENREKLENFYSIQFPNSIRVLHGNDPGDYVAKSSQGTFSVELIDIPDDSNVELFILTNIKPTLESSLDNFKQTNFTPFSINGHRAWELAYTWNNNTTPMTSIKTIVEGADEANAITYSGEYEQLIDQNLNSTLIQPVLRSFHWMA